jgi:serine/threonine protein kinase
VKNPRRYEIVTEIGRGSTGAIYRAKDVLLDRDVALKVLSAEASADPELKERFFREARLCARLSHPNIVPVYDFGQDENGSWIVMQLLEGCDLRRIIAEGQFMSVHDKIRILAGVCSGLEQAHRMGVVHRDIKPSNIFVESKTEARILDFGVAHAYSSSLTRVGSALGTPQYMSPEQKRGEPCDARSDIFAIGVVAYEFLSGRHPFSSEKAKSELPVCAEQILRQAIDPDPQRRPGSAIQISAALDEAYSKSSSETSSFSDHAKPTLNFPKSAGTQTVLSAVLVNLQQFEIACEKNDLATAQHAFEAMKNAGAGDARYSIALTEAEKRLKLLAAEAKSPQIAIAITSTPAPSVNSEASDVHSRPLSATAAPDFVSTLEWDPVTTRRELTVPLRTAPKQHVRNENETLVPARVKPAPRAKRVWLPILGCLGLVCIALAAIRYHHEKPATVYPAAAAVANAAVLTEKAELFAYPDSNQSAFVALHRGDVVRVIRTPLSEGQRWTEVQWCTSTCLTPPLFVKTGTLGTWSSADPAVARKLQEMFGSSEQNIDR